MKRIFVAVLFILAVIAFAGCAKKQVTQAPEQPKEVAPAPQAVTEHPAMPAQQAGERQSERELSTKIEDIHFDFDKSDIRAEAKPILKNLADMLSANTKIKVVIEGNCDERGTSEYNLALGDRRANSAKSYLVSLGIPSSRTTTISYGKEKPLCSESTEECWNKNRRDHFVLTEAK